MKQSLKFLMFMMAVYYFLQAMGGNPGLHSQILQKYLKEVLKMSPTEMSLFMSALVIPWMIKPLYGMLSDFFPILGYRRKTYFILSGIIGAGAYFTLSQIGINQNTLKIGLILAGISFAFADVLCDAVMVEKGQPLNATDRLQSVQWAALGLAGVLIAYFKGQIAEHWTLRQAFLLVAIPPLAVILFTIFALKEEKSIVSWVMLRSIGRDLKNAAKSAYGVLMVAVALVVSLWFINGHPKALSNLSTEIHYIADVAIERFQDLIGRNSDYPEIPTNIPGLLFHWANQAHMFFDHKIQPVIQFLASSFWVMAFLIMFAALAYALVKSGGNEETPQNAWQGLKKGLKSKLLWGTAIFLFLFNCNPNLGTVFYFYEKDVLKFSDALIGKIDMVGSIGFVLGALLYAGVSKYLSHKKLLVTIIITGIIGNLSYLWFRDETSAYVVNGLSSVVAAIAFLGTLTVAAKACPKYAEGAIFAFIMSVMNFGTRIGDFAGSALWEKYTVAEKMDPRLAYARLIFIAAGFTAAMVLFLWMAKEESK